MIYIDKNEVKELINHIEAEESVPLEVAVDMAKDEFNHVLCLAINELQEV